MKLAKVSFRIPIPDGLREDGWSADYSKRVVRQGLISIPFEAVGPMTESAPASGVIQIKPKCHVCDREFNNKQALGGHRRQTGHQ